MSGSAKTLSTLFLSTTLAMGISGCSKPEDVDAIEVKPQHYPEDKQYQQNDTWLGLRAKFECEEPFTQARNFKDSDFKKSFEERRGKVYEKLPGIGEMMQRESNVRPQRFIRTQYYASKETRMDEDAKEAIQENLKRYKDNPNVMIHVHGNSSVDNILRAPEHADPDKLVDAILLNYRMRNARAWDVAQVVNDAGFSMERICVSSSGNQDETTAVYFVNEYDVAFEPE